MFIFHFFLSFAQGYLLCLFCCFELSISLELRLGFRVFVALSGFVGI